MAKIKLVHFTIAAMISDSKRVMDYLQKFGATELDNCSGDNLVKYDTADFVSLLIKKRDSVNDACEIIEKNCEIKRSILQQLTDFKEITYKEYQALSEDVDIYYHKAIEIIRLNNKLLKLQSEIAENNLKIKLIEPWLKLDIRMASKRTSSTRIFIGQFNRLLSESNIIDEIKTQMPDFEAFGVEVISSDKLMTNAVVVCHISNEAQLDKALYDMGFTVPDFLPARLPSEVLKDAENETAILKEEISGIKNELTSYCENYDELRFLSDFLQIQIDKYKAVELAGTTKNVFFLSGFIPERNCEKLKFQIESDFTACVELTEPDYDNTEVPVLIENGAFASGVEDITNMYSPVSNKDIDPNPVMAFFYYAFFGLMLADAGYGLIMVIASIFFEKKLKNSNAKKTVNMFFYCGVSSMIFGTLFGSIFGDLIQTVCVNYLGFESPPDIALWKDPVTNSIELLLYCLGFGILHLFAGLILNMIKLIKSKNYISAFFDTVPVMIFVCGFAVLGAGFLVEIPERIKNISNYMLAAGAALIVLTAGRSSKNIFGKFGAGLYALYNTATGYLGDILSYSRLLALSLVTGVIAGSINIMATMPKNVIFFVLILIAGHTVNIVINLIGTYVHTNRLQYVEFFSKFYEGDGKVFTPFKINSKHIIIKEDK